MRFQGESLSRPTEQQKDLSAVDLRPPEWHHLRERSNYWASTRSQRTGASNTRTGGSGSICAMPTQETCPGKKGECYSCGLNGHFEGSTACKPAGHNAKARRERAPNQMEEVNDRDSIGQVSRDMTNAVSLIPFFI